MFLVLEISSHTYTVILIPNLSNKMATKRTIADVNSDSDENEPPQPGEPATKQVEVFSSSRQLSEINFIDNSKNMVNTQSVQKEKKRNYDKYKHVCLLCANSNVAFRYILT